MNAATTMITRMTTQELKIILETLRDKTYTQEVLSSSTVKLITMIEAEIENRKAH